MKQQATTGIVLVRTNYGEADRIITILTPDCGKLRLMAKGVRKIRSKLAGGIELFSISDLTFIRGRGEIGTLISARLVIHYGHIIENLERVQLGYHCIYLLNRNTEDEPEAAYYVLLNQCLAALDDPTVDAEIIRIWFNAQLLSIGGFVPNLKTDGSGRLLDKHMLYDFNLDEMSFIPSLQGQYDADHIKVLRLMFGHHLPVVIQKIRLDVQLMKSCAALIESMFSVSLRI